MNPLQRLFRFGKKGKLEVELDDELGFHLERQIELNIAAGMSPEEARRQALIAFGGVQQTRGAVRQMRWTRFVDTWLQDLRYAHLLSAAN